MGVGRDYVLASSSLGMGNPRPSSPLELLEVAGGGEGTGPPRGSQLGAGEKVVKRCCSVTHGKLRFLSGNFFLFFFFLFIWMLWVSVVTCGI